MGTTHIRNMPLEELRATLTSLEQPRYRFEQVARWLYGRLVTGFDEMSDLPAALRHTLGERFVIESAKVKDVRVSAVDGTSKYLFELPDGNRVEAVRMPYEDRTTICVSSQVGCPLDCVFCETARGGFARNLTAGEILDQICRLKSDAELAARKINVVFMGMGEPLLNLDAVIAAIRTLNDPFGLDLGSKRITVSTSSFPERIRRLADADVRCSLALSLNAPDDVARAALMPKASRFPIEELLDAARYFVGRGRRRVTLEYVMLHGFNTGEEDADKLARLVRNTPFKLNLIPYNPGREGGFEKVDEAEIDRFVRRLVPVAHAVTVRRSRGVDIDAACGQLWTKDLRQRAAG